MRPVPPARRWIALARELGWIATSRRVRPAPPTWPVDAAALRGTLIRWPREYGWEGARLWAAGLVGAMGKHVRVERAAIPQTQLGIVRFEWGPPGRLLPIALDYGDPMDVDEACAAEVALYFKMQFRRGGYGRDNVVPGGYVPSQQRLYPLLGHLRALRARGDFRHDVYGRFSLVSAPGIRGHAVDLLNGQDRFGFGGGLGVVGFGESLREVAHSRVCLDLPGRGDLCLRLVEYLAVGSCVVSPRQEFELHVPLVDGEHLAYAERDLSDLVDVCERYVRDAPEREAMALRAREYFDRYLHRDQLAGYYLDRLVALR